MRRRWSSAVGRREANGLGGELRSPWRRSSPRWPAPRLYPVGVSLECGLWASDLVIGAMMKRTRMEQMPTPRVESLIAKLEKGRSKTRQILSSLAPAQWARIVYEGPSAWDVRDLLAHFVSAEERLLELAQDVASGGAGIPEGYDYDAFNAEEQRRLKKQSPEELLRALDKARQVTLEWLRTVDDAQLDRLGRHPTLGDVTLEMMATAIYAHQLLHMRDLQSRLIRYESAGSTSS